MDIEFDCGMIARNVGESGMAMKHHLTICEDDACKEDINIHLKKWGK